MDPVFQPMFVDPGDRSPLEFDGTSVDGRWRDGWLRSGSGEVYPVRAGIPDFIRREMDGARWTYAGARGLLDNGQYRRNWDGQNSLPGDSSPFAAEVRAAAMAGMPVVDVASGPGGGAMPFILQLNPAARVLAVDAGTPVLHAWSEFLESEGQAGGASFAGLDAAHMPLRDNCVAVITSIGGFSSIVNDPGEAWREAARVLQPGGRVLASEMWWDPEGCRRLAEALDDPRVSSGGAAVRDCIQAAGLRIAEEWASAGRRLRADDNELAAKAAELGIEVWLRQARYLARKG